MNFGGKVRSDKGKREFGRTILNKGTKTLLTKIFIPKKYSVDEPPGYCI